MSVAFELPIKKDTAPAKIHLSGVSREYRTAGAPFFALQSIDLEVSPKEFLCVVGPSGCGKSTLLHLIAGLDQPSSGEIWLDGHPISRPGPDRLLILQELGLFPWLTARENVEFGLKLKGYSKRQRSELARHYLQLVNLSYFEHSYPHQLSGGMKQRVALARALVMKPDVLLMDEPFAALDAQTRDRLHDELERIWTETGQTIIFVTHNVREAVRLGDRVVVMSYRPGRIKCEFRFALDRPRHLENVVVARAARQIHNCLLEEIDKSARAEYHDEIGD
jgi:NitT/TauT family transport system ATP-binding protein